MRSTSTVEPDFGSCMGCAADLGRSDRMALSTIGDGRDWPDVKLTLTKSAVDIVMTGCSMGLFGVGPIRG